MRVEGEVRQYGREVKAVVCKTTTKVTEVRILLLPNENIKTTSNINIGEWDASRFTSTSEYKLCVGVWVNIRINTNNTDSNRGIFSNALYGACGYGV